MAAPSKGDAKGRCTVCHETPEERNRATVPSCSHSFCASCIVSWGAVRGLCALCRAPFTTLLVNRALDGSHLAEPTIEPVTLLRRAPWVSVVTILPDVDTFAPPPADLIPLPPERSSRVSTTPSRSTAPYYEDERVEDELEEMFWEEEEKTYRELSRRMVGNRPHGANGFMSSGRQVARPQPLTRRQRAAAAAAASSSAQAPTRRKKKVKKNSRAGRQAAARENANSSGAQDAEDAAVRG